MSKVRTFRLDSDTEKALEAFLKTEGLSFTTFINLAIRERLDEHLALGTDQSTLESRYTPLKKLREVLLQCKTADEVAASIILMKPPVSSPAIHKGALAVPHFGQLSASKATLGISPSPVELARNYVDSLTSLGLKDYSALTPEIASRAQLRCSQYFQQRHYHRKWFDEIAYIVGSSPSAYASGELTHFDVIPWLASPSITPSDRDVLCTSGVMSLMMLLHRSKVETLFINGSGVRKLLERGHQILKNPRTGFQPFWSLSPFHTLRKSTNTYSRDNSVYLESSELVLTDPTRTKKPRPHKIQLYCWTVNLQSSFGVSSALREELKGWISKL